MQAQHQPARLGKKRRPLRGGLLDMRQRRVKQAYILRRQQLAQLSAGLPGIGARRFEIGQCSCNALAVFRSQDLIGIGQKITGIAQGFATNLRKFLNQRILHGNPGQVSGTAFERRRILTRIFEQHMRNSSHTLKPELGRSSSRDRNILAQRDPNQCIADIARFEFNAFHLADTNASIAHLGLYVKPADILPGDYQILVGRLWFAAEPP